MKRILSSLLLLLAVLLIVACGGRSANELERIVPADVTLFVETGRVEALSSSFEAWANASDLRRYLIPQNTEQTTSLLDALKAKIKEQGSFDPDWFDYQKPAGFALRSALGQDSRFVLFLPVSASADSMQIIAALSAREDIHARMEGSFLLLANVPEALEGIPGQDTFNPALLKSSPDSTIQFYLNPQRLVPNLAAQWKEMRAKALESTASPQFTSDQLAQFAALGDVFVDWFLATSGLQASIEFSANAAASSATIAFAPESDAARLLGRVKKAGSVNDFARYLPANPLFAVATAINFSIFSDDVGKLTQTVFETMFKLDPATVSFYGKMYASMTADMDGPFALTVDLDINPMIISLLMSNTGLDPAQLKGLIDIQVLSVSQSSRAKEQFERTIKLYQSREMADALRTMEETLQSPVSTTYSLERANAGFDYAILRMQITRKQNPGDTQVETLAAALVSAMYSDLAFYLAAENGKFFITTGKNGLAILKDYVQKDRLIKGSIAESERAREAWNRAGNGHALMMFSPIRLGQVIGKASMGMLPGPRHDDPAGMFSVLQVHSGRVETQSYWASSEMASLVIAYSKLFESLFKAQ